MQCIATIESGKGSCDITSWRYDMQRILKIKKRFLFAWLLPEVESSRTHFEVLGLGLEASSPRKLACPRLEDSSIFWIGKILWRAWKIFWKTFFCGDRLKNFCDDLFFFGEHLRLCPWSLASSIPALGLESVCPRKGCPWPRIFLCPWPRALCPRLHLWLLPMLHQLKHAQCKPNQSHPSTFTCRNTRDIAEAARKFYAK